MQAERKPSPQAAASAPLPFQAKRGSLNETTPWATKREPCPRSRSHRDGHLGRVEPGPRTPHPGAGFSAIASRRSGGAGDRVSARAPRRATARSRLLNASPAPARAAVEPAEPHTARGCDGVRRRRRRWDSRRLSGLISCRSGTSGEGREPGCDLVMSSGRRAASCFPRLRSAPLSPNGPLTRPDLDLLIE